MHPRYSATFTSINLLLGVGPLILPQPFFQAGVLLSTIWILCVTALSYTSAVFIYESIERCMAAKKQQIKRESVQENPSILSEDQSLQRSLVQRHSVISSTDNKQGAQSQMKAPVMDHVEMLTLLFGSTCRPIPVLIISIYLLGTSISKFIMTGKTLSRVFEHIPYLNTIQFWLIIFFISGASFSFRSLQKTGPLQMVIAAVRCVTILMMIGGSIYLIISRGAVNPCPKDGTSFNPYYFSEIFSNSVFSFMFHHSLPSIANTVTSRADARWFIKTAFMIAGTIQILLPLLASFAFGDSLVQEGSIRYYSFDFQSQIPIVYYVSSFYVFLNVAAISVYVIVIRIALLRLFAPKVDPNTIGVTTVCASGLLLVTMLVVSYTLQNQIQVLLEFTGGLFGVTILFFFPSVQVWKSRRIKTNAASNRYNSEQVVQFDRPNWICKVLPLMIFPLGMVLMGFNLAETIQKITKK